MLKKMFSRSFNAQVGLENDCSRSVIQFFFSHYFSLWKFPFQQSACTATLSSKPCFMFLDWWDSPIDTLYLTRASVALKSWCLTSWDTAVCFAVVSWRCWWLSPVVSHMLCKCRVAQCPQPCHGLLMSQVCFYGLRYSCDFHLFNCILVWGMAYVSL